MPTPGSPPTRTKEPLTSPPPNTRSNSSSPLETRSSPAESTPTSEIGVGAAATATTPDRPPTATAATASSIKVFHSPQSGHRPSQRGLWYPQPPHT